MKDLNVKELKEIEGGMNDRPFGTSYDGYPPAELKWYQQIRWDLWVLRETGWY